MSDFESLPTLVARLRDRCAPPKPQRGAGILAREDADKRREQHEREVAKAVKRRDGRCRWPEAHTCRGELEAAHIVDKSLGGETSTENELTICAWLHRRGPESIHGKQLKVEKETARGANGPLSFWRQDGGFDALGYPTYVCVAVEDGRGGLVRN
jgi:hypothetical protein